MDQEDDVLDVAGDRFSLTVGFSSVDAAAQGKYYYNADRIRENHISSKEEVADLFAEKAKPSYRALVNTVIQPGLSIEGEPLDEDDAEDAKGKVVWNIAENKYQANFFNKGDWVEYLKLDMEWKLAQITRVVLQAPDEWDYDDNDGADPPPWEMNVYYTFKTQGLVAQEEVRAPELGLARIFGYGPWLWQQHCLLLLERRLRFQEGHEHDFEEVDIQRFADRRFDAWVNAKGNERFKKHYDNQSEIARKLLATHLLTPFELMDQITEDEDAWDFEDPDISVYTYTSVLGSGCTMFIITLCIQVIGIFVLLINGIQTSDGEQNDRFFFNDENEIYSFLGFEVAGTNFSSLCKGDAEVNSRNGFEGKVLLFLVIVMYLCRIVPDATFRFYRVTGAYESCHSKINSLREIIWNQADDSLLQQVGYKFDRYMNTAFVAIVYMVLLFILFNTPNVLDIILNALAVEFLHEIDEKLADAEWWDRGNRWIRAGTQQLVIQGVLRLQVLESTDRICSTFDIDKKKYKKACEARGVSFGPLKDFKMGRRDDESEEFLSKKERLWRQFGKYAVEQGNLQASKYFNKRITQFGMFEKLLFKVGAYRQGAYHYTEPYRVWSRWEAILYLCEVPVFEDTDLTESQMVVQSKQSEIDMEEELAHEENSDMYEFLRKVSMVFVGLEFLRMVKKSIEVQNYYELPWRVVDAILQYFSYVVQLIFPFYVLAALFFYPVCY